MTSELITYLVKASRMEHKNLIETMKENKRKNKFVVLNVMADER